MASYQLDIQQSGSTLLQVDGAVIAGALIFLTLSSITISTTNTNAGLQQQIYVKWLLSIVTAAVITPFVISATYALVALYTRTSTDAQRAGFLHHAFSFSLIGFIYIPGFIVIIALGVHYVLIAEGTIFWIVIGGVIAVFVIAGLIGYKLRKKQGAFYFNIEPGQALVQNNVGAPNQGRHNKGEFLVDSQGSIFFCTSEGTPGTWVRLQQQ